MIDGAAIYGIVTALGLVLALWLGCDEGDGGGFV